MMPLLLRRLASLFLLTALSCAVGGAPQTVAPVSTATASSETGGPKRADKPSTPELHIRIAPVLRGPQGRIEIELSAYGPTDKLRTWQTSPGWAGPGSVTVTVGDETKPFDVKPRQSIQLVDTEYPDSHVRVKVRYSVPGALSENRVELNSQYFLARGRELLLLPAIDSPLLTRVTIETRGFESEPEVGSASSFGLGRGRVLPTTPRGIERAVFAGGWRGHGLFSGPEGYDESIWFGYSSFDPRPFAAEVASFRTAVRAAFGDPHQRPLLLVLMSTDRAVGGFDVTRATASVVARFGPRQGLSASLRLSVYHQILKEWLGSQLSMLDTNGAESVEFTEGFSRFLAREFAFEFGMLSPDEYLDEINGLLAVDAITSQKSYGPNCSALLPATDVERRASCDNLRRLSRGALHGTQLDSALRARNSSLANLLASLLKQGPQTLPFATWSETVGEAAGAKEQASLRALTEGASLLPGSRELGPCFVRRRIRIGETQLGFEYEGSPRKWVVTHVRQSGPAHAAGIREGLAFTKLLYNPTDTKQPIVVQSPGNEDIAYTGKQRRWKIAGFARARGVPDSQCLAR